MNDTISVATVTGIIHPGINAGIASNISGVKLTFYAARPQFGTRQVSLRLIDS